MNATESPHTYLVVVGIGADRPMDPEKQELFGYATVFATFAGPIFAVLATRFIDRQRERREARMNVFRALMRNRRLSLSPDFVSALNSVEVEFYGDQKIITVLEDLSRHYNKDPQKEGPNWEQERQIKLARLLRVMGRSLGVEIEQLDILSGGYAPQGWDDTDQQGRLVRHGIIQLLAGQMPLRVSVDSSSGRNDAAAKNGHPHKGPGEQAS